MTYKDILKIAPTIQAESLVANLTKKKKKRKLIKDAIDISVGSSLIKIESDFIAGL